MPYMAHFHEKLWAMIQSLPYSDLPTLGIALLSLSLLLVLPKIPYINKVPAPIVAMIVATVIQAIYQFPTVLTIGSAFGGIPQGLPEFSVPKLSFDKILSLIGPAFTIAMLGAIESLLSAVVADGMSGTKHESNTELFGQGLANIFAPLFGGIASTGAIAFQRFQTDELWQTKIIQTMIKIMEIQGNEKIRELATLALMQDLWLTFYENVKLSDKGDVQTVDEVAQKRVQLIMQYIHENYNHNLSLDEIASHIGISKSTALNLFHRFLHTTPVNYLIGYRLQAASWLLKNTNKKVKTIAYESGFHNVDYFCRLFKKRYHLTPSEYRCTCLKLLSADPSLQTHK